MPGATTGSITGVVVGERSDEENNRSLLFEAVGDSEQDVDGVRIQFPKRVPESLVPGYLPEGWAFEVDGKLLEISGPAVTPPLRFRFDLDVAVPKKLQVEILSGGEVLFREKGIEVLSLPRAELASVLDDVLRLPAVLSPGDQVDFRPLDFAQTPPGGQWVIGGVEATEALPSGSEGSASQLLLPLLAPPAGGTAASLPSPGYTCHLPADFAPGVPTWVTYVDAWGQPLVEVPAVPEVQVVAHTPVAPRPAIVDATPHVFPGRVFCVCGHMPTAESRQGLLANGEALGAPVSASSSMVYIRIPASFGPGPVAVTGDPGAGYGAEDEAQTIVLGVGGHIDREVMKTGQKTPLRLWIDGTSEPLDLELVNDTPQIISIEGGVKQTVTTTGGDPNQVVRTVNAESPGDFNITYRLAADPCPCAGGGGVAAAQGGAGPAAGADAVAEGGPAVAQGSAATAEGGAGDAVPNTPTAQTPAQPDWVEFSVEDFARLGLVAPDLKGKFDRNKPVVIIVHGDSPADPKDYGQLEFQFQQAKGWGAEQDYQVFRWVYQEGAISKEMEPYRDQLEQFTDKVDDGNVQETSFQFADAVKKLQEELGFERVNIVGHSMGGLISRDAATVEGRGDRTLANADFKVNLITFATPWKGVASLKTWGGIASTFTPDASWYGPMNDPANNFLHGTPGDNVRITLIKTNEERAPDYVITKDGQNVTDIDETAAEKLELKVGHRGMRYTGTAVDIVRATERAQQANK
jgi:hypothetical protein